MNQEGRMDFFTLAKNRYSERYFDSRPVEQEKLDKILEAGRIVPTACNYQPQRFYVLKSPEALAKARLVTPLARRTAWALASLTGSTCSKPSHIHVCQHGVV